MGFAMDGFLLAIVLLLGLPLLVICLAKRDRRTERHWGDQSSQANIFTGADTNAPRVISASLPKGLSVKGEEIEELSHRAEPPESGDK